MISPAPSPEMISPAPDSVIITPTPSPEMISPAPSPEMISPAPDSANIQLVPNLNEEVLPKKLTPTPPKNAQTVETQQLPNANSIANTTQQDLNSMVQSQE